MTKNLMVMRDPDGEMVSYVDQDSLEAVWTGDPAKCAFCKQTIHHFHRDDDKCPLCGTDDLVYCWGLHGKIDA